MIILILKDCYSGFVKNDVKNLYRPDGRSPSKLAKYSVFFDTDWIIVQGDHVAEKTVTASQYHSVEIIGNEWLARGPDFASNKNDIVAMAEQNAINVARLFRY